MNGKKFKSIAYLGWHFFTHFLKKILPQSNGMVRFKAFYLPDHIFPLTLNHRQKMPDYATCVSCRLCDTACPQLALTPNFPAPSYMVTGFSRSLTDHHLAHDFKINCADCRVCESICPQQVPIGAIMDFVLHNAGLPKAQP